MKRISRVKDAKTVDLFNAAPGVVVPGRRSVLLRLNPNGLDVGEFAYTEVTEFTAKA